MKKPPPKEVRASVWNSSLLSAVLALALVAEIVGLAAYGYYRVQRALDPENLADRAETAIRENYPEVREQLIEQIQSSSPQIAEQVSAELIASTPEARQQLEQFTARQIELGLDRGTELSAEQFRQILDDNRPQIVEAFEKLETAPQEAHALILETEARIEKELGVDLQAQAKNALAVHRQVNDKLERLTDEEATLDAQEQIERRIVRILKTLQEEPSERVARREAK
jgi:hypothetical protein